MQDLLVKIYDQLPADQKRLKWQLDTLTKVWSITVMGLKIELVIQQTDAYGFEAHVRTLLTNWQFLGGSIQTIEQAKEKALQSVAKQLSMLSHHIATLGNNFEQV